jgi:hypothetical protein
MSPLMQRAAAIIVFVIGALLIAAALIWNTHFHSPVE